MLKKYNIKVINICLSILMIFSFLFLNPRIAEAYSRTEISIKVVIDNYDEYENFCRDIEINQSIRRLLKIEKAYSRDNLPKVTKRRIGDFSLKNGQIKKISLYVDSFLDIFEILPNKRSDSHFSLENIEFKKNTTRFMFNPGDQIIDGKVENYEIFSKTSFRKLDKNKDAEIVIHYKYHPDLVPIEYVPPNPTYSKEVDYLGDGVKNEDTDKNGKRDYRFYLNLQTEKESEQNYADFIFVTDVSGSMLGPGKRYLEETLKDTVGELLKNEKNTISLISFSTEAKLQISQSRDETAIIDKIENMYDGGHTCYYEALKTAKEEVENILANDRGCEKIMVFVTDGRPDKSISKYTYDDFASTAYAYDEISSILGLSKFYSIFMSRDEYGACILQNMTQFVHTKKASEKIMVKVSNPQDIKIAMHDFLKRTDNGMKEVVINDYFSEYINITDKNFKAYKENNGDKIELKNNIDYKYRMDKKHLTISLLKKTEKDTKYSFSYDAIASDLAFDEYCQTNKYKNVGDANTDYELNTSSSNQYGFFPQTITNMSYEFSDGKHAYKFFPRPVIQVNPIDIVYTELHASKYLKGRRLKDKEFKFELRDEKGQVIATAYNDYYGNINFPSIKRNRTGEFNYQIYEVPPLKPSSRIIYDNDIFNVKINYIEKNDRIIAKIQYPDDMTFNNKYEHEPISEGISMKVILTGMQLSEEKFEFELKNTDTGNKIKAKNTDDGLINFAKVFTEPGQYVYEAKQIIPNKKEEHMIYDEKIIKIKVTVSNDDDGVLSVLSEFSPEKYFRNNYQVRGDIR